MLETKMGEGMCCAEGGRNDPTALRFGDDMQRPY